MYLKKAIGVFFIDLLTFGIGNLVFTYIISDKTMLDSNDNVIIPMKELVLTIVTFGLYGAVWAYKMGKKADLELSRENVSASTIVCAILSATFLRSFGMAVTYYRLRSCEVF